MAGWLPITNRVCLLCSIRAVHGSPQSDLPRIWGWGIPSVFCQYNRTAPAGGVEMLGISVCLLVKITVQPATSFIPTPWQKKALPSMWRTENTRLLPSLLRRMTSMYFEYFPMVADMITAIPLRSTWTLTPKADCVERSIGISCPPSRSCTSSASSTEPISVYIAP